jgi:hypothetical protein
MPLFHVQDTDRPMYVIAETYSKALEEWAKSMVIENECHIDDMEPPLGIRYVCPDDDLILS